MKILLMTPALGTYRGTQRMFHETAKMLSGNEILCWAYESGGESADKMRADGFDCLVGQERLADVIAFRPDVVNIHRGGIASRVDTRLLLKLKAAGSKVVETSVFGGVDFGASHYIDISLQISKWDLHRWNLRRGVLSRQLGVYVPYMVDTDSFRRSSSDRIDEYRNNLAMPHDAFVVGRVGKTAWSQIAPFLLQALNDNPKMYFLSVADYDGNAPECLRRHERFREIPRLWKNSELALHYSALDCMLATSPIGESFGMVIAESMACGTPVMSIARICSDNAQAELIGNNERGWLLGSAAEIPRIMGKIATGVSETISSSSEIRKFIVDNYSREVVSAQIKTIVDLAFSGLSRKAVLKRGFITDTEPGEFERYVSRGMSVAGWREKFGYFMNTNPMVNFALELYGKWVKGR